MVEETTGVIDRIRSADRRKLAFVVVGGLLVILALTGFMNANRDVDLTREEAVELARPHVDFEPVNADARLVRQGFQMSPVWAVSFSIPEEGGTGRDFERITTVEINAQTGEVVRISVDNFDERRDAEDSSG
ncbi:MAG: hypothetical protein ACR2P0_17970 [Acidimicrobiales bacterium]